MDQVYIVFNLLHLTRLLHICYSNKSDSMVKYRLHFCSGEFGFNWKCIFSFFALSKNKNGLQSAEKIWKNQKKY